MQVKVDVYIPNPLRCYSCQVFGHHENKCGRHPVCCNCDEPKHCGPSSVCEYQSVVRNIRREEVVLARLRLGHTRITHSYLLQGEEPPQCVGCDAPFTVRHFLLECGDFAQVRNNCFHVDNMKELFQDIHIDSIMTFLRQMNLFNKI